MVVFPFKFLEVTPKVLRANTVVSMEPFLRPGPELLATIAHVPIVLPIGETVKSSMANKSTILGMGRPRSTAHDGGNVHAMREQWLIG